MLEKRDENNKNGKREDRKVPICQFLEYQWVEIHSLRHWPPDWNCDVILLPQNYFILHVHSFQAKMVLIDLHLDIKNCWISKPKQKKNKRVDVKTINFKCWLRAQWSKTRTVVHGKSFWSIGWPQPCRHWQGSFLTLWQWQECEKYFKTLHKYHKSSPKNLSKLKKASSRDHSNKDTPLWNY